MAGQSATVCMIVGYLGLLTTYTEQCHAMDTIKLLMSRSLRRGAAAMYSNASPMHQQYSSNRLKPLEVHRVFVTHSGACRATIGDQQIQKIMASTASLVRKPCGTACTTSPSVCAAKANATPTSPAPPACLHHQSCTIRAPARAPHKQCHRAKCHRAKGLLPGGTQAFCPVARQRRARAH